MVSKYEKPCWEALDFKEIQSTNQIKCKVEKKHKKIIGWYTIYRILKEYVDDGKIEMLKTQSGLFWRKK